MMVPRAEKPATAAMMEMARGSEDSSFSNRFQATFRNRTSTSLLTAGAAAAAAAAAGVGGVAGRGGAARSGGAGEVLLGVSAGDRTLCFLSAGGSKHGSMRESSAPLHDHHLHRGETS